MLSFSANSPLYPVGERDKVRGKFRTFEFVICLACPVNSETI